ncbi:hypothetical protein K2173_021624 [Erythroxylum novogranatense]|uniref:Protein RDM1 n=1 Tax=Erythroxylum novogranatense TaxID=1862640 RepID=A0AAV8TNG6_9ROSI|nr:hypothetical protein K2173_021624 [Erythroxylum novogranatense]
MKRTAPWDGPVDVISSDESCSSEAGVEVEKVESRLSSKIGPANELTPEDLLIRRAAMYQEYMKSIPVPTQRGSVIPFSSWVGLGKSIKQLYGQPLHYLTNMLLKQWDEMRVGSNDEHLSLDFMIHPCKAEASIWLVEEIHRRTTSPSHVAKLWLANPMYHAYVDSIFPQL